MYSVPHRPILRAAYGQDASDLYGGGGGDETSAEAPAAPAPAPSPAPTPVAPTEPVSDLSSTMVLRGAVGVLAGAAVAPRGYEAIWAAAGFVAGATLGEVGIVGLLAAALWKKAGE